MNEAVLKAFQTAQALDITTTGRASGQPRTVELWFAYQDGHVYFLAGLGQSGTPTHWCRNLQANPEATITIGGASLPVRLEAATDDASLRALATSLFRKKYGPATMRQWYDGGNHLPVKLKVLG